MNKTQITLGLAALALGLVAVNSLKPSLAYQGDINVKGPNYTEERHETNVEAFKNNDYKKWSENMAGRGVTRFVNETNFAEFAKAQVAALNGDSSLINSFREENGMGMGSRNGNGNGQGMGRYNR